jgi:hypothetical protein
MLVSAKARRSPLITPDVAVTVVTAARTPPADWLLEAHDSLRQPGEVSWEWALQIDGTVEDVRAVLQICTVSYRFTRARGVKRVRQITQVRILVEGEYRSGRPSPSRTGKTGRRKRPVELEL